MSACRDDSPRAYAEYLSRFTTGRHVQEAQIRLDDRSWENALAERSQQGLEDYVKRFPDGRHAAQVPTATKELREELFWERVQSGHTIGLCDSYLLTYPRGRFVGKARALRASLLEERDWREAESRDIREAYASYLKRWPSGQHVMDARDSLDRLAWALASRGNTIRSYQRYLSDYPDGRFVSESERRVSALRVDDEPFRKATSHDGCSWLRACLTGFVDEFPGHRRMEEARRILENVKRRSLLDRVAEEKVALVGVSKEAGSYVMKLKVRRLIYEPVCVTVPVGTPFGYMIASRFVPEMIAVSRDELDLDTGRIYGAEVNVVSIGSIKAIVEACSTYTTREYEWNDRDLEALVEFLSSGTRNFPFSTRFGVCQAAVWVVTSDAGYESDLRSLVWKRTDEGWEYFPASQAIEALDAAIALRLCTDAGVDIAQKRIWEERQQLAAEILVTASRSYDSGTRDEAARIRAWLLAEPP